MRTMTIAILALLAGGCYPRMGEQVRPQNVDSRQAVYDRQAARDANELAEIDRLHQEYLRLCPDPPEEFLTAMQRREPYVGMSLAELVVAMGTRPADTDCLRTVLSDGTHDRRVYTVKHYEDGCVPYHWHTLYVYLHNDVVTAYQIEPQSQPEWTHARHAIQPDDVRPGGPMVVQQGRPTDDPDADDTSVEDLADDLVDSVLCSATTDALKGLQQHAP